MQGCVHKSEFLKRKEARVTVQHPPLKTPVDALSWICQNQKEMTELIDWWAKLPAEVAGVSEDLNC